MNVATFPFDALPRMERALVEADRDARRTARALFDPRSLAEALARIVDANVSFEVGLPMKRTSPSNDDAGVGLGFSVEAELLHTAVLECDRVLATEAVIRGLGRPEATWLASSGGAPSPELCGALAGMVATALRRAAREHAPRVVLATSASRATRECFSDVGFSWVWPVDVTLGASKYAARLWAPASARWVSRDRGARTTPAASSNVPVAMTVFASIAIDRADLASLAAGDWLSVPALNATSEGSLAGEVGLAAPSLEVGLRAELAGGRIRFLGERAFFSWAKEGKESPVETSQNDTVSGLVGEVPLVGRVEFGSVEMTAAEWSNLARGDLLLVGARVTDHVTLRVGGAPVARGELVVVEGEVGVRVTAIFAGGDK